MTGPRERVRIRTDYSLLFFISSLIIYLFIADKFFFFFWRFYFEALVSKFLNEFVKNNFENYHCVIVHFNCFSS